MEKEIRKQGNADIEAAEREVKAAQEAATSVQSAQTAKCGAAPRAADPESLMRLNTHRPESQALLTRAR